MDISKIAFGQLSQSKGIDKTFEDFDVNNDGKINQTDVNSAENSELKAEIRTLLNMTDEESLLEENADFDESETKADSTNSKAATTTKKYRKGSRTYECVYDAQGRMISQKISGKRGVISESSWVYNSDGTSEKTVKHSNGKVTINTYDANGKKVKTLENDKNGNLKKETNWTHNADGGYTKVTKNIVGGKIITRTYVKKGKYSSRLVNTTISRRTSNNQAAPATTTNTPNETPATSTTSTQSSNTETSQGAASVTIRDPETGKEYTFPGSIFTYSADDIGKIEERDSENLIIKDKNGKVIASVLYKESFTTTHTGFVDGKGWTKAERIYTDGSKIEYKKVYHDDGTYEQSENRYNKNGDLVEIRTSYYNAQGKITKINEYVGGHYDTAQNKYVGGLYNERTREYDAEGNMTKCTRTGYTDDTKTHKVEYKEYEFLNREQTIANVTQIKYKNGVATTMTQTCYFDLVDDNGCKYRYYTRSDGAVEIWHYDSSGVRTEVSVTYPNGYDADGKGHNQVIHRYNGAGESLGDTWSNVNINDIINKYGKINQ